VIKIGKDLIKRDIDFCIITRGYKSKYEDTGVKVNSSHSIEDIGDEASLFRHYFPNKDIYIGKNRIKSIKQAIANMNKFIILDDGFQTGGVYKDMKIMLLNSVHKYYYLRNFKFLIREEDIVFNLEHKPCEDNTVNKTVNKILNKKTNTYKFSIEGLYDKDERNIKKTDIKDEIIGFSALGDNERFKQTLIDLGLNLVDFHEYKDHHSYSSKILQDLNKIRINKKCSHLICSEKDYIKIKNLNLTNIPLIYVKNSIQLNLNLIEIIIEDAEKKGIIKT
jgi:tetraacyldisaccharide 4'-kinase